MDGCLYRIISIIPEAVLLSRAPYVADLRYRTGVARGLSLVWCVLCSLSLCLLLLPFCRSTPLYISAPEGFNRGFAPTIRQKMLGGVHQ
ncbi:hypothetical protein VNO80_09418 [Phaseolus coccineus]|uniref:Uncharacterized protein n=1 Tax=Phaseolus coccineus TaxID=3886 RepID=A0AAN9N7Y8_PHACN